MLAALSEFLTSRQELPHRPRASTRSIRSSGPSCPSRRATTPTSRSFLSQSRPDRHRRGAFRRRRAPRRSGGEGHDRRPHCARRAHDRRRRAVVLETRARPVTPRDLTHYPCINLRLPTYGGFYAWQFAQRRRGNPGSGRWTARVQRRPPDLGRGVGRLWSRPSCRRTFARSRSLRGGSSNCLRIGARASPVITSMIRAAASPAPPSR